MGLSILVGVALANLKYLDLKSSRNLMILGVSLLFGLIFPFWINDNPEAINTGMPTLFHLDLSRCPLLHKSLQPPRVLLTVRVVIEPESLG